ncbi:MAG: asparagine synthase-related protein [Thermoleophilaceae bacterium]
MTGPCLAGVLDPRGGMPHERRAAAAAALEDGEGVAALAEGPLAVAVRGGSLHAGDGTVCALEGAVYNLPEVAAAAGADPAVTSPAALLAVAWRRLDDVLELLRGDFTLLLWDVGAGRGLLATDQLGGRGLVWHRDGARLTFASEPRQLLRLLSRTPEPDRVAVAHWLAVSGMPGDRSLYAGVRRLRAAHLLPLGDPGAQPRRYWQPRYKRPLRASRAELAAGLRERLATAVERRLPEPGQGAVMLSGGLDSATVAGLASRAPEGAGRPRRAYSATFPRHPSVDEGALIERLCDAFGLTGSQAVVSTGSVVAGALPYLDRWGLPPVSPNLFFWQPLLRRAAGDGVRLMIDGEGGDEVFGLSPALIADRVRRGRVRSARGLVLRIPGAEGRPSRGSVRRIMREHGWKAAAPARVHRAARALRGPAAYAPDWFTPATARDFAASDDQAAWKRARGPRWWAHLVEVTTSGMGPALVYDHVRRRALMAGLEPPRHPLVDVDVIEYVLTLPPELAYDPFLSRPLLREAMAGLLPDEVRLRPSKSTFDAVFHESLAGSDLPVVRGLLAEGQAEIGAYADLAVVRERLFERPPPKRPAPLMHWALHTWRMVTAECWLRSLADPAFPARLAEREQLRSADCDLVERAPAA